MKIRDIFLAIVVAVVWGMNFTVTKIGLEHFPPLMLMGMRFLLVAILLAPFLKKITLTRKQIYLISLTYGVCYHALAFSGLWLGVDAAIGIIAVQMQVPFTALLGVIILHDTIGWRRILGMITAFAGIVIIVDSPNVLANITGFMLIVIAAFLWSIYNIQIKKWGTPNILPFLAWLSLISAPQLLFLSFLFESNQINLLLTAPLSAVLSVAYIVIFSTIVGLGIWSYLIHHYSVQQISPFSMLAPVFGVISAALLLHEKLGPHLIIGGLITITGVTIIVLRKPDIVPENAIIE